jgi:hypothetical protein
MKGRFPFHSGPDPDIVRQHAVQSALYACQIDPIFGAEIDYLAKGMDPRVSSSGAVHLNGVIENLLKGGP